MPENFDAIKADVLRMVLESRNRQLPAALEKKIARTFSLGRKAAKSVIRGLVANQDLIYTYQYGCSFLEPSFNKPVRVSKYVVLKPPEGSYDPEPGEVVIQMRHGASFGTGQHPTTRLAIRGIEYVLRDKGHFKDVKDTCLLDIGTGSGVLAITALHSGIAKGMGIDTDPCSVAEAKENVRLNRLEGRIHISDQPVEHVRGHFSMIIANLRYPTLKQLCLHIAEIIDDDGIVILSGIKADELGNLLSSYSAKQFACLWKETEKDWAGVVLEKMMNAQSRRHV